MCPARKKRSNAGSHRQFRDGGNTVVIVRRQTGNRFGSTVEFLQEHFPFLARCSQKGWWQRWQRLLLAVGVALLIYGLATRPSQQKCVANTVVYLHQALQRRIATGVPITNAEIHAAAVEGAVHRLRPELMTVTAVLASLAPILAERDIASDVMQPIAGGMLTSTIHVLILVPVFFVLLKERARRRGTLNAVELEKL